MALLLVLAARGWWPFGQESASSGGDPVNAKQLTGRTAAGFPITLAVVDGKLQSFDTHIRAKCTDGNVWETRWYPADGAPAPFHHDGRYVVVVERANYPDIDPPSKSLLEMNAVFSDDRASARGQIYADGSWRRGRSWARCRGTTTFHAGAQN